MTHNLLEISNLAFTLPHKNCFSNFSSLVTSGSRIAIIGNNGSGKSSLLKIIKGLLEPSDGLIKTADYIVIGYVSQVIKNDSALSGGQRFNSALTNTLSLNPDLLLLDEPTNHLDLNNRRSLMRLLNKYKGALIIASHDTELLRNCIDTLWHIDNGKIHIFKGKYDDYIDEVHKLRSSIEGELELLNRKKKDMHK
jgi:ATPase subunit of ABC transporter with duplicated ATPase domains